MTGGEEWRPIPGFPGYEASSLGRLRSIDRVVARTLNGKVLAHHRRGQILEKNSLATGGYRAVVMSGRTVHVHRAVCLAWHGLPPDGHEVAHNNGIRLDNRPENLRWASRSDNHADKRRHGTHRQGEKINFAKLTEEQVREILASDESSYKLAERFNVCYGNVWAIRRRLHWKHVPMPNRPVPARMEGA